MGNMPMRKTDKQYKKKSCTKCESLDWVEVSYRNRIYPLIYCHMEIAGDLDIGRLKKAVQESSKYVPEILYAYDFKHNRFVSRGFNVEDIILTDNPQFMVHPVWDLSKYPQLRIGVDCGENGNQVIIGMSHILSDGAGFLQYIYLLTSLYNDGSRECLLKNKRDISWILKGVHIRRQTEQTRYRKTKRLEPLWNDGVEEKYYLIKHIVSSKDFEKLHRKARQHHVTMNDIFMTAYARVIARIQCKNQVLLSCPADLRKFGIGQNYDLTVANMTGIYRDVVINCEPGYDFTAILLQVHIEMKLQKSRFRCFKGIQMLDAIHGVIPYFIVEKMIRTTYQLPSVSYTNIGIIDSEKLYFQECEVKDCIITGSYRQVPDFQLAVSSFNGRCTLDCALIGDAKMAMEAEGILKQVVKELIDWVN